MEQRKKLTTLQEKREEDNNSKPMLLKITDVHKVIRKKFKKARKNRLDSERDVNRTVKPLTTKINEMEVFSLPVISSARKTEINDPNILCTRLRVLLDESKTTDKVQRTDEINAIINHLHEQDFLV